MKEITSISDFRTEVDENYGTTSFFVDVTKEAKEIFGENVEKAEILLCIYSDSIIGENHIELLNDSFETVIEDWDRFKTLNLENMDMIVKMNDGRTFTLGVKDNGVLKIQKT